MSKSSLGACVAVVVAASVFLAGCGGGGGSSSGTGPKTVPVTGTVTKGGQPVEGATVKFTTVDGKKGASGRTDAKGNYTLSTAKPGDGALPGQYQVTITKIEAPASEPTSGNEGKPTRPNKSAPAEKNALPEKYAKAASSGLTATVKESGNKFDFTVD